MSLPPPDQTALWCPHQLAADGRALDLLDREWLLTNGAGGFAMGTVPAINTRRYHGLLVAALRPPVARVVLLGQLLETLRLQKPAAEQALEFSTCLFRDASGGGGGAGRVAAPAGYQLLKTFRKGLSVEWLYAWGQIQFVRRLYLHQGAQAATVEYLVRGLSACGSAARLEIAPLLALRDFHGLLSADAGPPQIAAAEESLIARRGEISAALGCGGARFEPRHEWWYRIWLPAETERGQADSEDLYEPGRFVVQLEPAPEHRVLLTVALGETVAVPAPTVEPRARRLEPVARLLDPSAGDLAQVLAAAADDFVVDRPTPAGPAKTIIAGYPWFADWGRDTFIALPGLLLETQRYEEARQVLEVFAAAMHRGLVPNRFDDYTKEAAHYNTVDASLWFAHAAMQYVLASGDSAAWRGWLGDAVLAVIDAYIQGTDFDIRMAGDGLISAGSEKTQLTWMDAAVGDVVFTPRHGKAVEVNALWYHVLAEAAEMLGDKHPQRREHFQKLAARIRRSFGKVFWDEQRSCLFDHVWTDAEGREQRDPSLRPNQIFAVSLPHSPLPRTRQEQVLAAVRAHLLTPYGLRTLPPSDPRYHGRYRGNAYQRDEAYHQGTVWAWLIGPYAEAVLRAGKFSKSAKDQARQALQPLLEYLADRGLGQIHEIFEADPPHRPVGCMAQAWSVAEVLRVWRLAQD